MKKYILASTIVLSFVGCNSVKNSKYKLNNKEESSFSVSRSYKLDVSNVEKVTNLTSIKYKESESLNKNSNISESLGTLSVGEGEITKTSPDGSSTTIKGKNITTSDSKKEASSKTEYSKGKEYELNKEDKKYSEYKESLDSLYNSKFNEFINKVESQKDKKSSRFPMIIPIILVIGLLLFGILNRYGLISFKIKNKNNGTSK
jgi:hypothetical protein